ncbi:hypothetical protein RGQ29_030712 [Quercus rubra]|uniref:Uncharacterized protein n=1 Tax=Quercus rubra TaxID=3512 RepID=A0AAN7EI84_QUERU|nr:hypothetical protein RGQ29_030712 [Quercus rubra]
MEGKVVMMCAVIGFLGLSSVILGFAAESTRIKPDQVHLDDDNICIYPKSSATALGTLAVLAILVSEIITSVATGCICCRKRGPQHTSCNWTVAQVCFFLSWITVVTAAILLLRASVYKGHTSTVWSGNYSTVSCYVLKPGVFAAGAILCLASVVLALASYILSLQKNSNNLFQGDIAMAQPQFAGGTSIYQGATPIGQPQYQSGNPAVPNQGDMPMGHTKFPQ